MPATTPCGHNFCLGCLERSFLSGLFSSKTSIRFIYFHSDAGRKDCPSCRAELDEDYKKFQNKDLRSALQLIFPGYETGR